MNHKRTLRIFGVLVGFVVFQLVAAREARAQWQAAGTPVAVAPGIQQRPAVVSDGSGGAIFTWMDTRNGATKDIYAQRVNAAGTAVWEINGIPICEAVNRVPT
jgi:hypothetical protein